MSRERSATLAIGLALVAAACSTASDAGDEQRSTDPPPTDAADPSSSDGQGAGPTTGTEDPGSTNGTAGRQSTDDEQDAATAGPDGEVELFSPTETTAPLDLSGGVRSSDEDLVTSGSEGDEALDPQVRQATEPWPTDWTRRTVDPAELQLGIPAIDPRDRIRPIDVPRFEPIAAADWLAEREPGALVRFGDQVRFYPLSILTRHEVVNDRFGDVPVVVTYCPLCNTAIAFDARVDGEALRFGVSGLLRNSDLVMWDEATTSLWQQITGEAIVGELAGTQLDLIPTSIVAYGDVLAEFPDAWSLSRDTGFDVAYGANPYEAYSSSERPFLFADEPDPRFPALSRVVGVDLDDAATAYPFAAIAEAGVVNDEVGGVPIAVFWGGETADALDAREISESRAIGSGIAYDRRVDGRVLTFTATGADRFEDGETGTTWTLLGRAVDGPLAGEQLDTVPHRNEFWFAWAAFFPDAPVHGDGSS